MNRKPALMVQGTGSNVGKSLLVAGLVRAFKKRGIKVAPFKPQNMSNNAGIAGDGEIGRAQMLQARAAGVMPTVDMNPVLLKPESETGSQIIVQGKRFGTMRAREYGAFKKELLPHVLESFQRLEDEYDLIIVEGAGSPAEVNLRAGDIANMGFAEAANVPVILVGDIDRGGVIASIVGTAVVMPDEDRNRIKGFVINKFRGDACLFNSGLREIEKHTQWPSLGVMPHFPEAAKLPAEDVLDLPIAKSCNATCNIIVPRLPRIANFDDLDPLSNEPNVNVELIEGGRPLPQGADLILIPGSKSTIADLEYLLEQGWDIDIKAHLRAGGAVMGLCGGYQMLGRSISDPDGVEGQSKAVAGLGLLDVETIIGEKKATYVTIGTHCRSGAPVTGYEIHLGQTIGPDCLRPVVKINGRPDGAQTSSGNVSGTYMHGLFGGDEFRQEFLRGFDTISALAHDEQIEQTLDALAVKITKHLDLDALLQVADGRSG